MSQYRTAMGKTIDMDALRTKNENVRAVGNMNVNARGDTLDSHNNVINDASKRVNKMYQNTMLKAGTLPRRVEVPQQVAQQQVNSLQPDITPHVEPIISAPPAITEEPEFLDEELEFDFGDDDEPVGKEPPPETKKKK